MAQQDIFEIFEDCIQRMAEGQSIEDCLDLYPQVASRLRSMLETIQTARSIEIPQAEILEDQALVWQIIEARLPQHTANQSSRRFNIRLQLLVAIILLLLLTATTWFILTRPDLRQDKDVIIPIVETMTYTPTFTATALDLSDTPTSTNTPTATQTASPSATSTLTMTMTSTASKTVLPSATVTMTSTPSRTALPNASATTKASPTASKTAVPTATFAPGCGAPLTLEDATNLVLNIYPNTTITSIKEVIRFNDVPVWDVLTSHNIEITIDITCGNILTIERRNGVVSATPLNDDTQDDQNLDQSQINPIPSGGDDNGSSANSNDDNKDNEDDNSGMGSNDSNDDNSGMGSDD